MGEERVEGGCKFIYSPRSSHVGVGGGILHGSLSHESKELDFGYTVWWFFVEEARTDGHEEVGRKFLERVHIVLVSTLLVA
jgi:hypothetical protein